MELKSGAPVNILARIECCAPEKENEYKIDRDQNAMHPRKSMTMIGEKFELEGQEYGYRYNRDCQPCNQPEQCTEQAFTLSGGTRKDLGK